MILDETRTLRVLTETRERLYTHLCATHVNDVAATTLVEAIDILGDGIIGEVRALNARDAGSERSECSERDGPVGRTPAVGLRSSPSNGRPSSPSPTP